jgi:ribosomal protein S18 acetylase RimI-like enzyme
MALHEREEVSNSTGLAWYIQSADWRDFSQLKHLEKVCFNAEDNWPFWDLLGILTLPGLVRLKAVMDGRMVGFIGGERDSVRRLGWVTTLAVLPEFRRRGIALALLSRCEDMLAMPAIRLTVRASNQAAIGLYEQQGYRLVDQWKRYYACGEDGLVFEKNR